MPRHAPDPPKTASALLAPSCGSSTASKPFASSSARSDSAHRRDSPKNGAVGLASRSSGGHPSPSPRRSTAKHFATKLLPQTSAAGSSSVGGAGLSASTLAHVKEHTMSMAQRIDQIMKVPKVDARPEMYRIDVKQEEDLRRLHDLQSKRDPELQAHKLSKPVKGARDVTKSSFNFLEAAEVSSVGGTSTVPSEGGGSARHHAHAGANDPQKRGSQKKHIVPTVDTAKAVAVSERKHYSWLPGEKPGEDQNVFAPWERPTEPKREGKLTSPRSNLESPQLRSGGGGGGGAGVATLGQLARSDSGRSQRTESIYEFVPSMAQLRSTLGGTSGEAPAQLTTANGEGAPPQRQPSGGGTPRLVSPRESILVASSPNTGRGNGAQVSSGAAPEGNGLGTPRMSSVGAAASQPSPRRASSVDVGGLVHDLKHLPSTRGASTTATYRPQLRTRDRIARFEATQPRNELPPRPQSAPRGCALDFTHDFSRDSPFRAGSAGRSVSECDGSTQRLTRMITIGRVTSPIRPLTRQVRQHSPASSNPNVLAPENPPPKRLSKDVPPPGGRRGSSGIFDLPNYTPPTRAFFSPKKSLANMSRLAANTLTSNDNTVKSPSLEGVTDAQHAAAQQAPLRRTLSSLQTSVARAPESLKAAVPVAKDHVSRRMLVTCEHAMRLQSSQQVSSLLSWQ